MHNVKNTAKGHRSLWARQPDGNRALEWLDAGETKKLDVDPLDPVFAAGELKIFEAQKATAKPAGKPKPKPSTPKSKAAEPAPETPADPGA